MPSFRKEPNHGGFLRHHQQWQYAHHSRESECRRRPLESAGYLSVCRRVFRERQDHRPILRPANQIVVADAVKFVYVQPASPPEASPLFPGKIFQVSLQGDSPTNRTAETSNTWAIWPPPPLPFATNSAPLPGPDETNHPAYELRLEP